MQYVGYGCMAETNAVSIWFAIIYYSVLQAARSAYNRYRTVSHGIHLIEATGFYPAGHQQKVCACIHLVTQFFIVGNLRVVITYVAVLNFLQCILNPRVAAAKNEKAELVRHLIKGHIDGRR